MNANCLIEWISSAIVDEYKKDNKHLFVATNGNEQLILTCHRVEYSHGRVPHITLIWLNDDGIKVLYQDIVDATGQIKHGVGDLQGEHTARENIEDIWLALMKKCPTSRFRTPAI
jgi:hypothetical protein